MKEQIHKFFNKEEEINKKIFELEEIINTTKDPIIRNDSVRALLEELKNELIDTHYESITDDLTGFLNKKNIEEVFGKMVSEAKKGGMCVTLILADIDYLKYYNDNFGHLKGTELIVSVAGALAKSIRNSDIAIRYGGDEFMLLCLNAGEKGGEIILKRIDSNVAKIKTEDNVRVTLSIGCETSCSEKIGNYEDMFVKADKKLYEAKEKRVLPKRYVR